MKTRIIHAARGLMLSILAGAALVGCGGGSDFKSPSYTLGGTVSGLNGSTSVQLATSTGDTVTVSQNGAFQFPTAVALGGSYAVSVAQQPASQTCVVTNGSGSVTASVSNVAVSCATNGYTISGTVSGLDASTQVTLSNNGAESVVVSADGTFSFATPVQAYSVTVTQQPTGGKFCSVSRGSGTASADVSDVGVSCIAVSYLDCPTGQALAGIQGRKGGIIDQLEILCANMLATGVDSTTTASGGHAGGNGGSPFGPFACPAGEWISGVSGANGSGSFPTAMASVQVTCSGGGQSPSYNSGGINPFSFSCATGKRATGFVIGAVGAYTGFMQGMTCEP